MSTKSIDFGDEPTDIAEPMPKKKPKPELERINIKMSKTQLKALQGKAAKYTDGNLSKWLRLAGLGYTPMRK